MGGIYLIINVISNKGYVGQSCNPKRRWVQHKCNLKHQRHSCHYLQNSWNKYGADAFIFEILEVCSDNLLTETEQYWMNSLRFMGASLYNTAPAAGSCLGLKHTEKAKQKLSLAKKGVPFSEEHKKALSVARKARAPHSEETKKRMSESQHHRPPPSEGVRKRTSATLMGHKVSDETRKKIAETLTGRTPVNKGASPTKETRIRMSTAQKLRFKQQSALNKIHVGIETEAIRLWKTRSISNKAIARQLGLSASTITNIVRRNGLK